MTRENFSLGEKYDAMRECLIKAGEVIKKEKYLDKSDFIILEGLKNKNKESMSNLLAMIQEDESNKKTDNNNNSAITIASTNKAKSEKEEKDEDEKNDNASPLHRRKG